MQTETALEGLPLVVPTHAEHLFDVGGDVLLRPVLRIRVEDQAKPRFQGDHKIAKTQICGGLCAAGDAGR